MFFFRKQEYVTNEIKLIAKLLGVNFLVLVKY